MASKMLFATFLLSMVFAAAHASESTSAPSPAATQTAPRVQESEKPVEPYDVTNENAGADPFDSTSALDAFHGEAGISRIVDSFVLKITADSRIEGIFRATDKIRLRRTLKEQFCYLLGGPCDYTGKPMGEAHKDHGITTAEFNIVVEALQAAMKEEGVSFRMQNKLLSKLAPMHRDIVTR